MLSTLSEDAKEVGIGDAHDVVGLARRVLAQLAFAAVVLGLNACRLREQGGVVRVVKGVEIIKGVDHLGAPAGGVEAVGGRAVLQAGGGEGLALGSVGLAVGDGGKPVVGGASSREGCDLAEEAEIDVRHGAPGPVIGGGALDDGAGTGIDGDAPEQGVAGFVFQVGRVGPQHRRRLDRFRRCGRRRRHGRAGHHLDYDGAVVALVDHGAADFTGNDGRLGRRGRGVGGEGGSGEGKGGGGATKGAQCAPQAGRCS